MKSVKPWVMFAGGVLVVAVLYWAQGVPGAVRARHPAHVRPDYRANIRTKIADVRGASNGGTVEKLQETL